MDSTALCSDIFWEELDLGCFDAGFPLIVFRFCSATTRHIDCGDRCTFVRLLSLVMLIGLVAIE